MTFPTPGRLTVLVPTWVTKQLARLSLNLSTIFQLNELKNVLSQEDLALLVELNQNPAPVFGETSILGAGLTSYWMRYAPEAFAKVCETLTLYEGRCAARLYAGAPSALAGGSSSTSSAGPAYEVREVESGLDTAPVRLVIISPGHFGGPHSTSLQQQLRRDCLKQSYVSLTFDGVARDPLFLQYLLTV